MEKSTIRFIDTQHRLLFTLSDGESVRITYEDGAVLISACAYLGDDHVLIGNRRYSLYEFAEQMDGMGAVYEPKNPVTLPAQCYSTLPSSGELIILRCGESGYYSCQTTTKDRNYNEHYAEKMNRLDGVSAQQQAAMEGGSLFGWQTPAAKPQSYDFYGRPHAQPHREKVHRQKTR